jgi:hypothetical protein
MTRSLAVGTRAGDHVPALDHRPLPTLLMVGEAQKSGM